LSHSYRQLPDKEDWEVRIYKKTLPIKTPKKKVEEYKDTAFVRKYLINRRTNSIITTNKRAWSDTCAMAMWLELVVEPFAESRNKRIIIIWDNCGSHGTHAINQVKGFLDIYLLIVLN